MEHPLVEIDKKLTADQLQEKLNELTKKLGIAYRSGNGQLMSQLQMAIEAYKNRYQEKLDEVHNAQNRNLPDYANKINIS
jgi:hypothetical protein